MAEFKVINTQEEFDERIKERIERAEKKAADAFKGWLSPDEVETLKKAAQPNNLLIKLTTGQSQHSSVRLPF